MIAAMEQDRSHAAGWDRLQLLTGLRSCWYAVQGSQRGWASWLGNSDTMNAFTLMELRKFYAAFAAQAITFLRFDLAATQVLLTKTKDSQEQNGHPSMMVV